MKRATKPQGDQAAEDKTEELKTENSELMSAKTEAKTKKIKPAKSSKKTKKVDDSQNSDTPPASSTSPSTKSADRHSVRSAQDDKDDLKSVSALSKDEKVEATDEPRTCLAGRQATNHETQVVSHPQEFDLRDLLATGAHYGHQARRWNPKMEKYVYAKKDGVHIFDLAKTAAQLTKACEFVYQLGKAGKSLVFVGTKRQAREIVRREAERVGAMYIINRWLGGLITNWEQVSKSLKQMLDISEGLRSGKFDHYTKKERVDLDKKVQRLERFFGGISQLKKLPDALFIIDVSREKTAVKEAFETGIPVVALVDSNSDPDRITHVIPANDDAARSIEYVVRAVANAYGAGKGSNK